MGGKINHSWFKVLKSLDINLKSETTFLPLCTYFQQRPHKAGGGLHCSAGICSMISTHSPEAGLFWFDRGLAPSPHSHEAWFSQVLALLLLHLFIKRVTFPPTQKHDDAVIWTCSVHLNHKSMLSKGLRKRSHVNLFSFWWISFVPPSPRGHFTWTWDDFYSIQSELEDKATSFTAATDKNPPKAWTCSKVLASSSTPFSPDYPHPSRAALAASLPEISRFLKSSTTLSSYLFLLFYTFIPSYP